MHDASLLTNHVTIDVLQRLFFSESKPAHLIPIDLNVMAYLILRRCEDHEITDSYLTIAQRVCADPRSIPRSLERLKKLDWIAVRRRRGTSSTISVNADSLPAAQPIRDKITPEAKRLVGLYMPEVQKERKRLPKNWHTRQFPSAQRILTLCGGDLGTAWEVIRVALMLPKFKKRAHTSLYHVLLSWKSLFAEYSERKQQYEKQQSQAIKGDQ